MSAASKVIKAAFTHGEGEQPGKREYGLRIRQIPNGKVSVSVKRTAGTGNGSLTVFKTESKEDSNIQLDSKDWSDESIKIIDEADASFAFLVLEAEFTDTNFSQIEVSVTNN